MAFPLSKADGIEQPYFTYVFLPPLLEGRITPYFLILPVPVLFVYFFFSLSLMYQFLSALSSSKENWVDSVARQKKDSLLGLHAPISRSSDGDAFVNQPIKLLCCVLCPQFLNETDRTADKNHGKDKETKNPNP